jgi:hypothetical protein
MMVTGLTVDNSGNETTGKVEDTLQKRAGVDSTNDSGNEAVQGVVDTTEF